MKKEEFLVNLQDILQRDEVCREDDILDTYAEWDSLSKMAIMAFYEQKFHIKLTIGDFDNMKSVSDLISYAKGKVDA